MATPVADTKAVQTYVCGRCCKTKPVNEGFYSEGQRHWYCAACLPLKKPSSDHSPATLDDWAAKTKSEGVQTSVLEEAEKLIYGDRKDQYGNAKDNFSDIAALWAPIIGKNIGPEAAALCLLQLKVARAINDTKQYRPIKRDTIVDLAVYAGCLEQIQTGQ